VPVPYADLHNPQSLNLYDYVGGDPTNHADADGHECTNPGPGCGSDQAKPAQNSNGQASARTGGAQNAAAAAPALMEGAEAALAAAANKMLTVAGELLGVVADAVSVPAMVVLTPTQLNSDENAQMAKIHAAEDNADNKAEPQSEPKTAKDRSPRGTEEQLKDMEREKAASDSGKRKTPVDSIEKSKQNLQKAVRDNPTLKDWEQ
jgi:hypothetical protein